MKTTVVVTTNLVLCKNVTYTTILTTGKANKFTIKISPDYNCLLYLEIGIPGFQINRVHKLIYFKSQATFFEREIEITVYNSILS